MSPARFEHVFTLSEELMLLFELFVFFDLLLQLFDFVALFEGRPQRLLLRIIESTAQFS
jgi:hypothetical protein